MTKIKEGIKEKLTGLGIIALIMLYLELALHVIIYRSIDAEIIFPLIFSLMAGIVIFVICALVPRRFSSAAAIILVTLAVLFFETQYVYRCIFGGFMPLKQIAMGAGAVTGFFSQMLHAIGQNILGIILIALPLPLFIFLLAKKKLRLYRINILQALCALGVLLAVWGISVGTLHLYGAYSSLTDPNTVTDNSMKRFGVFATLFQETKSFILPEADGDFTSEGNSSAEPVDLGVGDVDFSALALTTEDEELRRIDEYLAGVSPLPHNEYTGIAEGYNLITICAEAFSPYLIDAELTPTLYHLSHNGLIFNNFYNSFPNTTTNGEYTMCMGLMPNMSRNKIESSFNESADNYLPLCLGSIYSSMGYKALGYHNYYGTFYDRHITHGNMGYDFRAVLSGLDIPVGNPSSDLDMIEASMKDYVNSTEPFHVYYMTYSGHYQYNWDNEMSAKNRDKVEHLPYSEEVKAYIACNLELEYALEALVKGLEKAGQADKTVIVLTADHYPYGLTGDQYDELAGKEIDHDFEKYHNSFICYIPGIETTEVDSYCSTPDILPTVLNIMGIEYDSRLLAGSDVMADTPHMAVLSDHSFITDDLRYNAATGEVIYTDVEDEGLFSYYRNRVEDIFTLSSAILENDYYAHVFDYDGGGDKTSIHNFSDISNEEIYIESTVTFVVDKGIMDPKSETEFGKDDAGTIREFVEVLYRMSGSPKGYKDAYSWALENGLATEKELSSQRAATYGQAACVIHRFSKTPHLPKDLDELKEKHPRIKQNELVALSFCLENRIIFGDKEYSSFELYSTPLTRYHIAAFVQRMYLNDLI